MPKKLVGGSVYRENDTSTTAEVQAIDFPSVSAAASVRVGTQGTMQLSGRPPNIGSFEANDHLVYHDSTRSQGAVFRVDSYVGPTEYMVTRTA